MVRQRNVVGQNVPGHHNILTDTPTLETTAAVPTCASSTGRWILTVRKWIAKCKGHQKRIALSVPFESHSGASFWSAHLLFRLAFPSPGASRERFFFPLRLRPATTDKPSGGWWTPRATWFCSTPVASREAGERTLPDGIFFCLLFKNFFSHCLRAFCFVVP